MNCWYCEYFYQDKRTEEPCSLCVNKDKFKLWIKK